MGQSLAYFLGIPGGTVFWGDVCKNVACIGMRVLLMLQKRDKYEYSCGALCVNGMELLWGFVAAFCFLPLLFSSFLLVFVDAVCRKHPIWRGSGYPCFVVLLCVKGTNSKCCCVYGDLHDDIDDVVGKG